MIKNWIVVFTSLHISGALAACGTTQTAPRASSAAGATESTRCIARAVTLKIAGRVEDRPLIEGNAQPACARVWVVVHPLSVTEFWVQAMPTVRADGAWILKPHIGREEADYGEQFEVVAIANPNEELKEGLALTHWPTGEARSDVSVVTKVPASGGAVGAGIPNIAAPPNGASATPTLSSGQPTSNRGSSSSQNKNGKCELLAGDTGVDKTYFSGWLDLAGLTTFNSGSTLRLTIGGNAKKVLVRFLPNGKSPDQKVGVLGTYVVSKDRVLVVPVANTLSDIAQISVHGGPQAWDVRLPPGNGAATLEQAEMCQ